MRFLSYTKDGGKDSTVDAFVLIEIKSLFTIAFLRFNKGSRVNFHSHAFHALTWFLKGDMVEVDIDGTVKPYHASFKPKVTLRSKFHKVIAKKVSWCFTLRGAWDDTWEEYDPVSDSHILLTHKRIELSRIQRSN